MNEYDIHSEVRIAPWTQDCLSAFEREKRSIDAAVAGTGMS